MSLMNKFSVTYNLDRANKKKRKTNLREQSSISNTNNKRVLTKEVAESLLVLGYELDSVVLLFKKHYFSTVNEALTLLAKDSDTQMFNHKFCPYDKVQDQYKSSSDYCLICKGNKDEHLDDSYFEIELNKIELLDNKSKENIPITTANDLTIQPLVHETPSLIASQEFKQSKEQIVYGKVEIPQETLMLFDIPDICRICFAERQNPKNIAQVTCGHFFCDTCIKVHLTTKIVNGKVLDIKCLYGGCPKKYSNEEIKANVAQDVYMKFLKFYNEQIKLNNPNKIYVNCPFPNCEEIVDCENYEDEFAECGMKHVFCYKCHFLGKHKRGKCQNENIIVLQQIKKGGANSINYKQCPKCKVIIEKNEGCNQMHCISCQFSFCWLCLKKYTDDHYAIYNVGGCPGMRFENDTKSKWRRNPILRFLWYFLSCILGFWVLILILLFYLLFGCSYEFVKCYQKKKNKEDDDDSIEYEYNFDIERSNNQSRNQENINMNNNNNGVGGQVVSSNTNSNANANVNVNGNAVGSNGEIQKKEWGMIIFIGFLGFLCQPFYLTFYLLYGLMECYRRFNCWFYYVDY